tara:strand:- start:796 stop:1179 length:384 start_codon:yes stop_codon:yes gene_type:complete
MLEEPATMAYQYRMNVIVEEFGLMMHPKYSFLGASPDGIVNKYKLDGEHKTKYVGRMLYPKCPTCRTDFSDKEILLEEGLDSIRNNSKIDEKEKQIRLSKLLVELRFNNLCCKMRALTYVNKVYLLK